MSPDPLIAGKTIVSSGDTAKLQLKGADCEAFQLRIVETKLGECPAHFFITFPANERRDPAWTRLWQAGGGRGFDRERARGAAICEALERACLITSGPDDPRVIQGDHGDDTLQILRRAKELVDAEQPEAARELMEEWGRLTSLYRNEAYGRGRVRVDE